MEKDRAAQRDVEQQTSSASASLVHSQLEAIDWLELLWQLRKFTRICGFADDENVAEEVLSEVYIEIRKGSTRFDPARSLRGWLIGIGFTLIRRRMLQRAKQWKHEISISALQRKMSASDLLSGDEDDFSDMDFLDLLLNTTDQGIEQDIVNRAFFDYLVSQVSPTYQDILQRLWACDQNMKIVAQQLGCGLHTAYVRSERARKQLRRTFEQQGRDSIDG